MKNNYTYPAKIKRTVEEIVLEFVDFPNVIAIANSEEGLIEIAQEALALSILDCMDQGKEPPSASVVEEGAVYVHVWLPYYKNMAKEVYVKKTVTIPQWLDILAKENNVNFSACLVKGIKEELGI
ncbi:type II toxin-antitoxin system HicB family antitoxin [Acetobacterium wieringae]|uniref:HicB family protein n=1 Tax=Acetobacterium wieringae TaxID=52694 RepID=A0A1F2PJU2_9FIRM|nr:hypothetical protein [Acetobacterium wieringae]MEA4805804.1 type II toxin-antitoxin system HicB family antitoxin [Acetobacterium wieringae]OFV71639.1 hypothetical protein ACWI_09440 [Acetobacterium wieringae]